jgi:multidrug efflux pump subunit AcrA (membrane-fusion protein)
LNQAQSNFDRQKTLLARDIASRAQFEQAEAALKTARAQLDTAEAQLKAGQGSGQLHRIARRCGGTVVATGAEPGEVVQAGQMIIRVARKDGRDAVFDVPAQLLRSAPSDPVITVSLTDDPR